MECWIAEGGKGGNRRYVCWVGKVHLPPPEQAGEAPNRVVVSQETNGPTGLGEGLG